MRRAVRAERAGRARPGARPRRPGSTGPLLPDREQRALALDAGPHPHPAAGDVVADGVVEQVADEPLDEARVAARRPRARASRRSAARGRVRESRPRDDRGEVERPRSLEPALAAGERQQRLDQRAPARSPTASTRSQTARRESTSACGSVSATSSSARPSVSGVRSSCEALATNRRWASNAACSRASRPSIVSASSFSSSSGPVSASRSWRFRSEIWRVGRGHRPQRAQHPAGDQPAERDRDHAP